MNHPNRGRCKYDLNEDFFSQWSPIMAYVLGFWFADGYMRKEKSYRIVFAGNDKDILVKICNALSSNHPISRTNRDNCYYVSFYSKKLYTGMVKRGGQRKKSRVIEFPKVPKKYLPDLVRGYFDGDGSVFFVEYIRTKDQQRTKELRTNFTSGSRKFLEKLMKILHDEIGVSLKTLGVFNDGGSLKLGYGMRDSDTLLHYMYYDKFPIGMKRKAEFLSKIPSYQRHYKK